MTTATLNHKQRRADRVRQMLKTSESAVNDEKLARYMSARAALEAARKACPKQEHGKGKGSVIYTDHYHTCLAEYTAAKAAYERVPGK